jgi:hypothetical protein
VPRHALRHAARVDEHQRRPVRAIERRQPVVDIPPDLVRHHRFERRARQLDAESMSRRWPSSHDLAAAAAGRRGTRDLVDRLLRRRQADRASGCRDRLQRSSDSARCAPRRVPMTAWISSTMTVRTVAASAGCVPTSAAGTATRAS